MAKKGNCFKTTIPGESLAQEGANSRAYFWTLAPEASSRSKLKSLTPEANSTRQLQVKVPEASSRGLFTEAM